MTTSSSVSRSKTRRGQRGHPQTNPNSLANLIPYKKGQNGHQGVYPLKERLYHALDHPLKEPTANAPVGERIVYATLKGALDLAPHPAHLKEVWDRVEGKVPEPPKAQPELGNRIINIFVGTEKAKLMVEGLTERLLQRGNTEETMALE